MRAARKRHGAEGLWEGGPLFQNPRSQEGGKCWAASALRRRWKAACRAVGLVDSISLYEGTKHTFATAAKARGIEDRVLQRFLGHRDRGRYSATRDSLTPLFWRC